MEFATILVPIASAVFAFVGALVGNKTDIAWIKRELTRHDKEITTLHKRVSNVQKKTGISS